MASNSTAWVLASRLSADEPKRQRFRRAISKFNASFLVRSNLISARRRSISCRDSSTESLAGEVSMVGVAEASSMGKVSASRVREKPDIRQWTTATLYPSIYRSIYPSIYPATGWWPACRGSA